MLQNSDLFFKIAVVDPAFNMRDNPYAQGEIKLHRYTSINDHTNILTEDESSSRDEIIELRECDYGEADEKSQIWN